MHLRRKESSLLSPAADKRSRATQAILTLFGFHVIAKGLGLIKRDAIGDTEEVHCRIPLHRVS